LLFSCFHSASGLASDILFEVSDCSVVTLFTNLLCSYLLNGNRLWV
jgi:hypothetical protein